MPNERDELISGINLLQIYLTPEQIELFLEYAKELREWNKQINLISRRDIKNLIPHHFLDSLSALRYLRQWIAEKIFEPKVIDIGSGGGLPGIPLKIACPEIHLTLLESITKKAKFLEYIVKHLNLQNVEVINLRAEEFLKNQNYRGQYDFALARAVAKLKELLKWSFPLLRGEGILIAYKTDKIREEIKQATAVLKRLNGLVKEEIKITLPIAESPRILLLIKKR
ncbi:MAG: 16S rRNA (guanine(527)-N(7))-methyltransferase RsmG [Candidatus Edwardsbacteria bacterium]